MIMQAYAMNHRVSNQNRMPAAGLRLAFLLPLITCLAACSTDKVMLVGDSFWQRDQMRQGIHDRLTTAGVEFDFVGGEGRGTGPANLTSTVSDPDHEGIASKQLTHIIEGRSDDASRRNRPLAELLGEYDPDVVAIQIGINDIFWNFNTPPASLTQSVGRSTRDMLSDVDRIARLIHEHDASAQVIFTAVTPVGDSVKNADAINERILSYNAALAHQIEELSAQGLNAHLVDSFAAWNGQAAGHTADDGLHPNQAGNEQLAQAWAAELRRALTRQ